VRPKLTKTETSFSAFMQLLVLTLPVQHNKKIGKKVDGNKTGRVMMEHLDDG